MKYKFFKFFVILILSFSTNPQHALAHAQLIKEVPAGNAKIVEIPERVSLDFDNQIIDLGSGNDLRVLNKDGVDVSTGDVTIVGANLSKSLSNTLEPGKYKVSYRVVSEDGHVVAGEYFFTIVRSETKNSSSNEAPENETASSQPEKSKISSSPEAEESKADAVAKSGEKTSRASEKHKEHDKDISFFTHHRTHIIWTLLVLITLAMIGYYRRFRDN